MRKLLFILLLVVVLTSCIGGGTHGYIKAYQYTVSKHVLEKVVHQIIFENAAISQDTSKGYYNDETNYVTISVMEKALPYTYTFRYYGGKEYWDTSKVSEIFIAYAHDAEGKGGSSGNVGVRWYQFKKKERLIEPFEKEFISRIDSVLGIKHLEE